MTDYQKRKHEPLLLRVKPGGELDTLLRTHLEQQRPISEQESKELGIFTRSGYLPRWLDGWFDNVRAVAEWGDPERKVALHYTYVTPDQPIAVSTPIDGNQPTPQSSAEDISTGMAIRWPQTPPFIQSMGDKFREPAWFNTMRTMVNLGKHIALAGPPGVGKDTAVQELAAQEGKVLVSIGGDAGFRRRDLVGTAQIVKGTSFLDVAEYAAAVVNGWWALLTEVNAADADALMFINTQLAPPYIVNIGGVSYPVHPDFRLFVSYNPGLTGTKPLPQSFKDRFFSIQVPFFDRIHLRSVLSAHGMPDEWWADKIVDFGVAVWKAHERGQLRYQITSRRLQDACTLLLAGLTTDPKEALAQAVIAAIDSPVESQVVRQILETI